ncbi:MAG: hypothetical protein AAF226_13300 [Verrucomicrobiota bacterium]
MSEAQKLLASVAGAVVGHIVAFFVIAIVFITSTSKAKVAAPPTPAPPDEVTISLAELMEQIVIEPDEPEAIPESLAEDPLEALSPETPPEELARERAFVDTDGSRRLEQAPENARFESDRNTAAGTEVLPDLSQPQEAGPTTKGAVPISVLTLRERDYQAGEIAPDPQQTGSTLRKIKLRPQSHNRGVILNPITKVHF